MEGRVTPLDALSDRDRSAWQALADRAAEPNPFFEPAFVLPAARHLAARDGVEPALLGAWDGDQLRLAAPLIRVARWRRLPLAGFATWCHAECYLGTPLLDPEPAAAAEAWRAAIDALAAAPGGARGAVLEQVAADGPARRAMRTAPRSARVYETLTRAVLRRRPDDAWRAAMLSGRHRRELERRARQVEQLTGGPYATEDAAAFPGAIDDFLALEAAGWKGRAGSAADSDDATRAFMTEVLHGFALQGRLHLLRITTAAGVAAAICVIRSGATASMFKTAYDESLARYSPGTQLAVELVAWFQRDESLQLLDTCAYPTNQFANRLFPDRLPLATLLAPLDRRGRAVASLAPTLVAWSRRIRRVA